MITEKRYKTLIKILGVTGMVTLTLGGWNQNIFLIVIGLASSVIAYMLQIFRK